MITSNAAYLNLLSYTNKLNRIITAQSTAGIQQTMLSEGLAWAQRNYAIANNVVNQWISLHPQSTSASPSGTTV